MTAQEYAQTYGSFYRNLPYRIRTAAWNHHCDLCKQTIFQGDKYHALDLSPREFKHEVHKRTEKTQFAQHICSKCVNIVVNNYVAILSERINAENELKS